MNFSVCIRLWGALDVAYVLWRVTKDILESKIPFFSSFSESLSVAAGFGQSSMSIVTVVTVMVTLSVIFSGPLMLALSRTGVYVSLTQFPFRLALLMPPTFFFVHSGRDYLPGLFLIVVVLMFEVAKMVTEIIWLKEDKE